ncbi:MAG: DUF2158 domain-containing protein [Pseudomonadota bacterium]|jgi:uncharacterized protein YodC (DUF2158 family)
MANKFAPGDVVVLKSGGPPMVVDACPDPNGREKYACVWQKGATHMQHAYGEHVLESFIPPVKK